MTIYLSNIEYSISILKKSRSFCGEIILAFEKILRYISKNQEDINSMKNFEKFRNLLCHIQIKEGVLIFSKYLCKYLE